MKLPEINPNLCQSKVQRDFEKENMKLPEINPNLCRTGYRLVIKKKLNIRGLAWKKSSALTTRL